jgi:hypothetical protein
LIYNTTSTACHPHDNNKVATRLSTFSTTEYTRQVR